MTLNLKVEEREKKKKKKEKKATSRVLLRKLKNNTFQCFITSLLQMHCQQGTENGNVEH